MFNADGVVTKIMTIKVLSFGIAGALVLSGFGIDAAQARSNSAAVNLQRQSQSQSKTDQDQARREMQAGRVLSLRQIEKRILPQMKGSEYLGPAYDSAARAYRLKFIKKGRVTYVDVDARTGRIINRSS